MSPKPLTDVWINLSREIGLYWGARFAEVPSAPGVYAWFYPLRISTPVVDDFVNEIRTVFGFDSNTGGPAAADLVAGFAWHESRLHLDEVPSVFRMPARVRGEWESIVADSDRFDALRRAIMKASIFMPPLYVGKSDNLHNRCNQHLAGSTFSKRYERFAQMVPIYTKRVADLLFACVPTPEEVVGEQATAQEVAEEILKYTCCPAFSKR